MLYEANNINKAEKIYTTPSQEAIQKPYTSAPRMVDTSIDYDNLTEIPLSNLSKCVIKHESDKSTFSSKKPSSDNYCENLDVDSKSLENIFAVDELLKCSSKVKKPKVVMPSVEDGLSSGSEIGSPPPPSEKYEIPDCINAKNSINNFSLMRPITKDIEDLRIAISKESPPNENIGSKSLTSENFHLSNMMSSHPAEEHYKKESLNVSRNAM